jgi:hypothetical protein
LVVENIIRNAKVEGSIPFTGTTPEETRMKLGLSLRTPLVAGSDH